MDKILYKCESFGSYEKHCFNNYTLMYFLQFIITVSKPS